MGEVLQDKACGSKVRTANNVEHLDDIGVVELTQNLILPLNFGGFDGEEHFDDHALFGLDAAAFKNMRVATAADLVREGIVLQLSPWQLDSIV